MSKNRLRISLDFHGVIDKHPQYFSTFTQLAKAKGVDIYVVTGGPQKKVEEFLQQNQIEYKEVFAILDFYAKRGEIEYFPNGEYKVPDILWNKAKGDYCAKKKIDLHIDDSREYGLWFSTPFCHYNEDNKECRSEKIAIDFSSSPQVALDQIIKIFMK